MLKKHNLLLINEIKKYTLENTYTLKYKTRPYLYHTDTTSGKKESVFINLNTYIHLIKPYLQLKTQNLFH